MLQALLTGLAQIMLQRSALTGALFLAGLLCHSFWLAGAALAGALVGQLSARLAGVAQQAIADGLYGFNGALVGIAMLTFFQPGLPSGLLLVLAAAASSWLAWLLGRQALLPAYTSPFILCSWLAIAAGQTLGLDAATTPAAGNPSGELFSLLRGIGQVLFQDYWLSGALFLLGLLLHAPNAAAWALIGAALGVLAAAQLGYPPASIEAGIFSYNAVLCAIALAARYPGQAALPLSGCLLSVPLVKAFSWFGWPALTAPFVLASWAVIVLMDRARCMLRA